MHCLCCHCQGSFPSFEGKLYREYELVFLARGSKFQTDQMLESNTSVEGFPRSSVGKESACVQETRVRFLGWDDPLEQDMATHSSILENPRNREVWRATVHGVAKSQTRPSD